MIGAEEGWRTRWTTYSLRPENWERPKYIILPLCVYLAMAAITKKVFFFFLNVMWSCSAGLSVCFKNIADHDEFTISDLFQYIFSRADNCRMHPLNTTWKMQAIKMFIKC